VVNHQTLPTVALRDSLEFSPLPVKRDKPHDLFVQSMRPHFATTNGYFLTGPVGAVPLKNAISSI
jgi:hypothetical protein